MFNKESMYPSFISNLDFRYIKLDNKYIANIIIYDFPRYNTFLSILEDIPKNIEYTMSIYVQKQDSYKILKELTYSISSSNSELKTSRSSQIDVDIINRLNDDANFLRKEIQINNQEIFYINFILTFYSDDKDKMLKKLKYFQSRLYSKQLYSKITNFRHLEEYSLSLPLNKKEDLLLKQNFRNFTTNALGNIFPFYTKNIFDMNGIIFGKIISENKLCNIDIFKPNYLNANMCILGSSGAGKSFFAKLLIIRHFINKKKQYIFDIEGEYSNIVKKLNGEVFSFFKNHINILQIFKFDITINDSDWYEKKINEILNLIKQILNFQDQEIVEDIKKAIRKAYIKYGITDDIESLYIKQKNKIYLNKVFKSNNDFPNFDDIISNLEFKKSIQEISKFKELCPFFCKNTDIDIDNKLISFDISNFDFSSSQFVLKYILDKIILNIKSQIDLKSNTIIYFDEVWKYISYSQNSVLANYIFELFKTIRKLNSSVVIITQDINDIFSKENINFGKSILNNCFFKLIFRLDFKDISLLNKISGINNEIFESINYLDKGQSVLLFNNNLMKIVIEASEYEKKLIEGENNGYFNSFEQ